MQRLYSKGRCVMKGKDRNYFVYKALKERKKREQNRPINENDFCQGQNCNIGKASYYNNKFPTHESLCPECHERLLNEE